MSAGLALAGRLAYVALFVLVLPVLLVAWAMRLDTVLALPAYGAVGPGAGVAIAGLALMAAATRDLWIHGHGLPASPFPPERLVTRGAFAIVPHPIYSGAVLVSLGVSLATRSAAGLWVVSPVLALAAAAFVIGFESDSTRRRYGAGPTPLLLPSGELRRFALGGLWATAILIPLYLLTALPAFHVVCVGFGARVYAARWPRLRWFWWSAVGLLAVSSVTTGMHAVSDVVAGLAAFALVARGEAIWRRVRNGAEQLANSWRETTIGPFRFMSHGIFTGVGAAAGVVIGAALAGRQNVGWIVAMTLAGMLGAALWAQVVEGSPQLLRPFGYFGAVISVVVLALVASLAGADAWLLFVSFGVGACFAQAIGRMRCLVLGCCHGREASDLLGIRYVHPLSRVVRLSALGGVPVHPTPLYSMAWMVVVGCVLLRLWAVAAPLQFIAGTYFILVGLGRFVEEHFRGEPQTSVIAGLRLYQWLAIAFVVGGAVLTTLGSTAAPTPVGFDARVLPIALVVGSIYYFAFGVDVPGSSRRFSRLR